jgi:hypothetical protein
MLIQLITPRELYLNSPGPNQPGKLVPIFEPGK